MRISDWSSDVCSSDLSGETASFLAGGEFPVPVVQSGSGGGGGGNSQALTIEWKPFGVSLAFTPTVLADGGINMIVAPEVSSGRKSVVEGKRVSDRVGGGGCGSI